MTTDSEWYSAGRTRTREDIGIVRLLGRACYRQGKLICGYSRTYAASACFPVSSGRHPLPKRVALLRFALRAGLRSFSRELTVSEETRSQRSEIETERWFLNLFNFLRRNGRRRQRGVRSFSRRRRAQCGVGTACCLPAHGAMCRTHTVSFRLRRRTGRGRGVFRKLRGVPGARACGGERGEGARVS